MNIVEQNRLDLFPSTTGYIDYISVLIEIRARIFLKQAQTDKYPSTWVRAQGKELR
jgi:hypothetical protein